MVKDKLCCKSNTLICQCEERKGTLEERQMAEKLHDKLCHSNHTDACGWYYGNWDKRTYEHRRYLEKAQKVLKITDKETIIKIVEALHG